MCEYKKLNNHPLVLVVVEIRYTPILKIKEYIPMLQDKLRNQYPKFNSIVDKVVNVNQSNITFSEVEKWAFTAKNADELVEIDQNRILYATSKYDRFDGLKNKVANLLITLKEVVKPNIFTRVGLRYCDNISSPDGTDEGLKKLVIPELFFDDAFSSLGKKGVKRQEYLIATGDTHLVVRTIQAFTQLMIPDDLGSISMIIKNDSEQRIRIMLDFDHFWQNPIEAEDFEVEKILTMLEEMHRISRKAFWKATTDYARNTLWL